MIRVLVLDVDGVLTNGSITYDEHGNEYKSFSVKDGLAIKYAIKRGLRIAIISGRESNAVKKRCNELGIKIVYQGIDDKFHIYQKIRDDLHILDSEIAYMGDDVTDMPIIQKVGMPAAPSDAVDIVKRNVSFISKLPGGKGAVREFIEYLLGEIA